MKRSDWETSWVKSYVNNVPLAASVRDKLTPSSATDGLFPPPTRSQIARTKASTEADACSVSG